MINGIYCYCLIYVFLNGQFNDQSIIVESRLKENCNQFVIKNKNREEEIFELKLNEFSEIIYSFFSLRCERDF